MIIYSQDSRVLLDTEVDDNSYRHRAIMGDHNITLHYSLAGHVELPVGAFCLFEGQDVSMYGAWKERRQAIRERINELQLNS